MKLINICQNKMYPITLMMYNNTNDENNKFDIKLHKKQIK